MIELRPLGQIATPPQMIPFVARLKRNYDRTVKTLMKATPRGLDSMLRSADQILSNEATLRARARSVRELRNLPEHEKTAALRGYYEAIKRAVIVIKSGGATIATQPAWIPSPTTPQMPPAYAPVPTTAAPVFQLPSAPPGFTMPSTPDLRPPSYVSPVEVGPVYTKPAFPDLPPPPPSYAPELYEPPPFTMPTPPPSYVPVEPAPPPSFEPPVQPPVASVQLLPLPRTPHSEKFKQILSDAISAAFRSLNLTAPVGSPGMTLSPTRYSHVVNVTYEVANKAGRNLGYSYTKRLIQDALQWRYITQRGVPAQLPQFGVLSPYTANAAAITPVPITPPTARPTIPPEPLPPGAVPGLTPVGPPAQIMDARFLSILNKWMDYFLKGQRYTVRPTYVWYIPRHMMERFVKEIGNASNREGGKYGYTYDKGLVWDALQRRGYEPSTKPDGTKRTPYDKKVQPSPYDRPGSSVPATGRQIIPPTVTPPTEIPDIPPPTAPPTEPPGETYSERIKRRLREARERQEAIERERRKAEEQRGRERLEKKRQKGESERQRKMRRYKERMKREAEWERRAKREREKRKVPLPKLTPAQRVKYLDMLNKAIDNRLLAAKWPTLPGKIISIQDADYEQLIASVQTFANMMAATIRETYHRFSSAEVQDALATKGYVRGTDTRPATGPGSMPLPARVVNFDDYKELIKTIQQKLPDTPRLVMGPELQKPTSLQYIMPLVPGLGRPCTRIMEAAIDQALRVTRRFDYLSRRQVCWDLEPLLEQFISPKAHAELVKAAVYSTTRYGGCPFSFPEVRDSLIARGYIPHPQGLDKPRVAANIGPRTAKWGKRGEAIYPWEVRAHFAAHFQPHYTWEQPVQS